MVRGTFPYEQPALAMFTELSEITPSCFSKLAVSGFVRDEYSILIVCVPAPFTKLIGSVGNSRYDP